MRFFGRLTHVVAPVIVPVAPSVVALGSVARLERRPTGIPCGNSREELPAVVVALQPGYDVWEMKCVKS